MPSSPAEFMLSPVNVSIISVPLAIYTLQTSFALSSHTATFLFNMTERQPLDFWGTASNLAFSDAMYLDIFISRRSAGKDAMSKVMSGSMDLISMSSERPS